MGSTKSKAKKTTKTAAKRSSGNKQTAASNVRIAKLVSDAIDGIEKRLGDVDAPLTIGDYIRLVQLQKDVEEEQPKEIKVTWVEQEPEPKKEK